MADRLRLRVYTPEQEVLDEQRRISREMIPIRVAVDRFIDRLERIQRHEGELFGVPTGFYDLDKLLGGFQPSDLIIVAGRPGSGKTSFALALMQAWRVVSQGVAPG